jgi:hypothetical protein
MIALGAAQRARQYARLGIAQQHLQAFTFGPPDRLVQQLQLSFMTQRNG